METTCCCDLYHLGRKNQCMCPLHCQTSTSGDWDEGLREAWGVAEYDRFSRIQRFFRKTLLEERTKIVGLVRDELDLLYVWNNDWTPRTANEAREEIYRVLAKLQPNE